MIFKISDGSVHCHAIAATEKRALAIPAVRSYFEDKQNPEGLDVEIERIDPDKPFTVRFDFGYVTFPAYWWNEIYAGCGDQMLCASEY